MYGTIVRFRPRPGQEQAVEELARQWLRERAPKVDGFIAEYGLRPAKQPGELLALTIFDSEANYRQNAADPEQHRWYERFRSLLATEPEWTDGQIFAFEPATVPL